MAQVERLSQAGAKKGRLLVLTSILRANDDYPLAATFPLPVILRASGSLPTTPIPTLSSSHRAVQVQLHYVTIDIQRLTVYSVSDVNYMHSGIVGSAVHYYIWVPGALYLLLSKPWTSWAGKLGFLVQGSVSPSAT